MTSSVDQGGPGIGGPGDCSECGAPLAGDQRYCLQCGGRNGPLPIAVADALPGMLARKKGIEAAESAAAEPEPAAEPAPESAADSDGADGEEGGGGLFPPGYMPPPRAAALMVLGMLGLGVLLGSVTSHIAQSAGLSSILLEASPSQQEETSEPEGEEEFEEAFPETETEETPEATPSSLPPEEVPEEFPEEPPPGEGPPEEFIEPELPPVKHVFLIVLGENGYEETFGKKSQAPYLSKTLPEQGELLPNYYAVTKGELANQIALVSGQGPTVETAANCPFYKDLSPGTTSTATGQVEGGGCVYPADTPTLMSRLEEKKLTWKAYVEDIGAGAKAGQPATCRHPALGASDPGPTLEPGDFYETWRNPFVYFHSVTDKPACAERDVGLDQLATDLKTSKTTPTVSYIVPSVCHDGGPEPCQEGATPGPATAEEFLKTVVPEIQASPAYKTEGGLIAITSAQAPQTGPKPDATACCLTPAYPNLPPEPPPASSGPVKASGGGGEVGMLLLSSFVKPGTVNESYFNHYSLLLSIEELFELERAGYTTDPGAVGFDITIYNNAPASVSSVRRPQSKRIRRAVSRPRATAPTVRVRSGQAAG